MTHTNEYSDKVYRKRAQVEKETAIENAYKDFKTDGKDFDLLEKLFKATTKHCRWSIAAINTPINTADPLLETTENV